MSSLKFRITLSRKARSDFIGILRYTGETWGRVQLLVYRDLLDKALETIRRNPEAGHGHDDLPVTLRIYVVGSHVIVYRVEATVSVARILHRCGHDRLSLLYALSRHHRTMERLVS
jgi:toxin ParE1/3/4